MSSSEKRSANALGAKTARPCESCLFRRARWYCAADDAFLCQNCDASVHSANQLARRHERVCLKTSSASPLSPDPVPSWLHGFRRKARTPRHSKPRASAAATAEPAQIPLLVPDLSSGDEPSPPDDEQLLYRVPIFDPVSDEVISAADPLTVSSNDESKPSALPENNSAAEYMMEISTCDADLAADMESLLGKGLDSDDFCMEALGLMESGDGEMEWRVKIEEADDVNLDGRHVDAELDFSCDTLDFKLGYESPTSATACEEEEEEGKVGSKKICLRLDHDAVLTAWATQGSPWMNGDRPNFNLDDCWPDWMGMCGLEQHQYEMGVGAHMMMGGGDRGREARVSRYREKRKSRLFSKRIRYEVRKLNAEKRPRKKGRFVKRTSLAGSANAFTF